MEPVHKPGPETAPRIPPLPMSEMRDEWIKTMERIPGSTLKGPYFPVNVIGTLMYNPGTMGPFLDYWVTSKLEMALSVREQELVILRMGIHYRCQYVWKHHVPVAREFGATDAELEAVKATPVPRVFPDREFALLVLTDEMVQHRTIREEAWQSWGSRLKEQELVDLISLVSQYTFFALFNNALQIEIEPPLKEIPGF
ncbi:MAG: carboxymuconolactone decarboxylase family protein [Bacteroidales bacterium]